jgi:tubulin-specific chaperone D
MGLICLSKSQYFSHLPISSYDYFYWLLSLQIHDWLALPLLQSHPGQWCSDLLEGLVSSADTGSEDLIRVSRAALADFCDGTSREVTQARKSLSQENARDLVCNSLLDVTKKNIANDRILVPALEVIGFLFDVGIMQGSSIKYDFCYINRLLV